MKEKRINYSEKQQTSTNAEKSISAITVVVPSLDEKNNILEVRDSLRVQRNNLSSNISLRLVISDNGSGSDTQRVYEQIKNDDIKQEKGSLDIGIVYGSKKGFNGSARHKGIQDAISTFHEKNPQASSDEHLIVSLDADTQLENKNLLNNMVEKVFNDPNTMVAYGPIKFRSSTGRLSSDYQKLQRPFTRLLLKHLFRLNQRRAKDYINPPYEVLHTIFTTMRESALVEKNNPNNIVTNYNPDDRAGVDVRMSLLLQRKLKESQIVYDKNLSVITSARGYETARGKVSRLKFMKKTFNLFVGTHYVPYALQRELDTLSNKERTDITKKLKFSEVIGSFAKNVDKEVYELKEGENLMWNAAKKRRAKKQIKKGHRVTPAINLKTGELLPNRFAIIAPKKQQDTL